MKLADIVQKSDKELMTLIDQTRSELAQAIVDSRTKESKNVKAILAVRKQLARTLTIARQRQVQAAPQQLANKEADNG